MNLGFTSLITCLISLCSGSIIIPDQFFDLQSAEKFCADILSDHFFDSSINTVDLNNENEVLQHVLNFPIAKWDAIGKCRFASYPAVFAFKGKSFSSYPFISKTMNMIESLFSKFEKPIEHLAKQVSEYYPFLGLLLTGPDNTFVSMTFCEMALRMNFFIKELPGWTEVYFSKCKENSYINNILDLDSKYKYEDEAVDFVRRGNFNGVSNLKKHHLIYRDWKMRFTAAAFSSGYFDFGEKLFPDLDINEQFQYCYQEFRNFYKLLPKRSPLNIVNAMILEKIPKDFLLTIFEEAISNKDCQVINAIIGYIDQIESHSNQENSFLKDLPNLTISDLSFKTILIEGQNRLAKIYIKYAKYFDVGKSELIFKYGDEVSLYQGLRNRGIKPSNSMLSDALKFDTFHRKKFNRSKFDVYATDGILPDPNAVFYCSRYLASSREFIRFILDHRSIYDEREIDKDMLAQELSDRKNQENAAGKNIFIFID